MPSIKHLLIWLLIGVMLVGLFSQNFDITPQREQINYSQFISLVHSRNVDSVTIDGFQIIGTLNSGKTFETTRPAAQDTRLIDDLLANKVEIIGKQPEEPSLLRQLLVASFPILLITAIFIFAMRHMQGGLGGRGGPMSFGSSKARLLNRDQVKATFADVAGIDESKEEVQEIVEFLRNPDKFKKVGGKIPKGILMSGSPGTGKTLLARAIAGEAGVPFFSISGSDFVEMFVGVGASRVRDMFVQAKKQSPCILFIDEIDAVGRHRGAGLGGGHDEREQTLNQLLVEMDGFEGHEGVIVIAATNRPDVLDPALLRPGRFDRQVVVPLPDILGREQILRVHLRKVPHNKEVDPMIIARATPGFSGADLANLVNEAALLSARSEKESISLKELDQAKDKILMGVERRSMVMSDEEKLNTAYHESGHAILGRLLPEHDPVYKVTIIPRGRALGVTMFLPEKDKYSHTRRAVESMIISLFGGRLAEELINGAAGVTTGAANDIERATQLARNMVTKWGLSDAMGPLCYDHSNEHIFLGRSAATGNENPLSPETANSVDREVRAIIDRCYAAAKKMLEENMSKLHLMSENLMKYETITSEQIDEIMQGKQPSPPEGWHEPGSGNGKGGNEIKDADKEEDENKAKTDSDTKGKKKTANGKPSVNTDIDKGAKPA